MSRLFFISTNTSTDPYAVFPLGVGTVVTALEAAGHQVRQFDLLVEQASEEHLAESIAAAAPDYICISIRNIDNVNSISSESIWYVEKIRSIVQVIRKATQVPIIAGGSGFSIMPEEILSYIGADYGVVGEGEVSACELIDALNHKKSIPRIYSSVTSLLPTEKICLPTIDEKLASYYMNESGIVGFQTKRGCPYQCSYCVYPVLEGSRFRTVEPREVAERIEEMKNRYGVTTLFFSDSIFNDRSGHHLAVAEALLSRDVQIKWAAFFRPEKINREDLRLLKRSGLYAMELGTDAASDETLAGLDKHFTFEDVQNFNSLCVEENIPVAHFVIFGGPGETGETVIKGLQNMERLDACVVFAFSGIRLYPGAKLHRRAIDEGVIAASDSLLEPVYYFSPHIEAAVMNEAIEKAFKKRRDRVFPPSEGALRMSVMHRLGFRGVVWDQLLTYPGRKAGNKK